jgi:hypothetical protein
MNAIDEEGTGEEEDDEDALMEKLETQDGGDHNDTFTDMPQEIEQKLVEQVYSADWNERQSAMEKLRDNLKNRKSISEEYAIELFSVL